MRTTIVRYETEAEAEAFAQGESFVNDSALNWRNPVKCPESGLWEVEVLDEDGEEEDE